MTVGSCFSGIGGFDLSASRVWGWDCVRWQVELDPWARRVLAKHWPEVPRHGDIRELTGAELQPVELICGGFPCQPFSLAGRQQGAADPRHVWPEMARLVSVLKPRWVLGENVPGLLKLGLDPVCTDLESLGYEVATLGIPACAVGAPHRRERVWIVAHAQRPEWGARQPDWDERNRLDAGRAQAASRAGASGSNGGTGTLADPHQERRRGWAGMLRTSRGPEPADCGGSNPDRQGLAVGESLAGNPRQELAPPIGADWWAAEPPLGRVAHGVSGRVDRLRGLGNAIVPQVAEQLFRWIDQAERSLA